MSRFIILTLTTLSLGACYTPTNNFRAMNDAELAAYNAGLSQADQVSCIVERRTGSYVKSKTCMTMREFQLRDLGVVSGLNSATVDNRTGVEAF